MTNKTIQDGIVAMKNVAAFDYMIEYDVYETGFDNMEKDSTNFDCYNSVLGLDKQVNYKNEIFVVSHYFDTEEVAVVDILRIRK